jgi:hypothetical protein
MKSHGIIVKKCDTDRTKGTTGKIKGAKVRVRQRTFSVLARIVIHLQQLDSKWQPHRLTDVLDGVVKMVTFMKTGLLWSRVFSRINGDTESPIHQHCCTRLNADWSEVKCSSIFELRAEITPLFFRLVHLNFPLHYLAAASLSFQSKVTTVFPHPDETTKLKKKLSCTHVEKGQLCCFPILENFSEIYLTNGDELKDDMILHMLQLQTTSTEHITPET